MLTNQKLISNLKYCFEDAIFVWCAPLVFDNFGMSFSTQILLDLPPLVSNEASLQFPNQ